ncbi:general substrate transporter [Lipomyces tetrasporus]|uniref:General substrate transporter n=1 Tax=Lipomyces tetrasporus TaxID=54092 RepID=A0AAD7QQP3_9ASCO|nr:general substrate transporter [Lipomyces tetrasporus]KAJ8099528.1 general substrate transporter [Lipomyces tetrasporus]
MWRNRLRLSCDTEGKHIKIWDSIRRHIENRYRANEESCDIRINDMNDELLIQAKTATEREHQMTLTQAIKTHPKAVGWSILISGAIIMVGFDTWLLGSFFALPQFVEKFGKPQPDGSHVVTAAWQAGLTNGALVGEIFGLFLGGFATESFGYRKTMMGALVGISACIFIQFFAPNIRILLLGYISCGVNWGIFQAITTSYASEVSPIALRAYLTSYVNLCWVIGQLLASVVLRLMLSVNGVWAYRGCYAVQWFWPIPLITGVWFAPESPWWLVRHGRTEDAAKSIDRLVTRARSDSNTEQKVAMMFYTNELELKAAEGTSFLDCLKRTDLRRTEIASVVWFTQAFCGTALIGYSTYFYVQAGLPTTQSFNLTLIASSIGTIGTIFSWALMTFAGRRTLYLRGMCIMFVLLIAIGSISAFLVNKAASWAIGSLLLVFTFVYDSTVGPVCYSIVAEIPSTRLRAKSIAIARNVYNVGSIVNSVITPYMLNPTAWNWKGKTGFFYAGTNAILIVWIFFRLPESKGLAYSELDVLFQRRVSARKFKTTSVDPFVAATVQQETHL